MIKNVKLEQFFKPFSCDGLIRLGKDNDGGYLVEKNSILNSDALLSFGIDHDWSLRKTLKITIDLQYILTMDQWVQGFLQVN